MSTTKEIKDARHYKEYLRVLRAQEANTLKRLANSRAIHEESPVLTAATFAAIKKSAYESLANIRKHIKDTKAVLATKVHINTKAENRMTRQSAAKRAKGRSR